MMSQMIKMRIDSCRNCGNELKVIELCSECGEPTYYQCEYCRKFTNDPVDLCGEIILG